MLVLEKKDNYIRKTSDIGSWFLNDWREITKVQLVDGFLIISDKQIQVELEGNIILLNVDYLTIDGLNFTDSESLKNYIING
jgi:hypothetical protein